MNNPFRRKAAAAGSPFPESFPALPDFDAEEPSGAVFPSAPPLPHLSSVDQFQKHLDSLPQTATPPPQTSFIKPKPKKKVRVQSPPPSSPESMHAVADEPAIREAPGYDSDASSSSADGELPELFEGPRRWTGDDAGGDVGRQAAPQNPFQKTLEDLEQSSAEHPVTTSPTSTIGKGSLDVSSFGRLLMTGQSEDSVSPVASIKTQSASAGGDAASMTDASSISRQSIFDATYGTQETPRTSHEISDTGDDDNALLPPKPRVQSTPALLRKKPPPPDSRHGKLIKIELKDSDKKPYSTELERRPGSDSSGSSQSKVSSPLAHSDVNKPLPPAPSRSAPDSEESDSIFDREAAGKVPEIVHEPEEVEVIGVARPPTPPKPSKSSSPTPATAAKKPPPPPRRHTHGNSENQPASSTAAALTAQPSQDAEPYTQRSSFESTRSRSSSIRQNLAAPAPPPPRRPNHNRKMSQPAISPSALSSSSNFPSSVSSPSVLSDVDSAFIRSTSLQEASVATLKPQVLHSEGDVLSTALSAGVMGAPPSATTSAPNPPQKKPAPPPPRPTRSTSIRSTTGRPPSVHSLDAASRRVTSTEKQGQGLAVPPPPPPRRRGDSRGSLETLSPVPRRTSIESTKFFNETLPEESDNAAITAPPLVGDGAANLPDEPGNPADSADKSMAEDILADLDALKREVEAARGQYGHMGD
jgi:hypothetical protein